MHPDSTQTLIQAGVSGQLLSVLEDIVHKVEVSADFSIRHPDYKPLELPVDAVARFQKLNPQMQQKYLSLQLRGFLYGIYYNGSLRRFLALDAEKNNLPLDLENNTYLGVDMDFYEQLHQSNFGEGYFDYGWSVVREETDGTLAVTKNNLRLHIEKSRHLQPNEHAASVGDAVAVLLPKNRVQNGFYMAVGNQGLKSRSDQGKLSLVRIYFNLTLTGAVAVMESLTQQLNQMAIPFSFKVLYNPKDYHRYDSGVLYFEKNYYDRIRQVITTVYKQNESHFKSEVPLFTLQLAPGLGLAEEPDQKFAVKESFGMNRCQIVANGLLEATEQRIDTASGRIKAVLEQFSRLNIDLSHVHLNANSTDIYTSLF
ncbi:MAG: T3SS effector HopA1 family protein [Nostoc sp.]|uniref:T3SS effector HopA1 family protein n=1 Tax=Nostoc sp. TaxID=1180 RepID=UPI002FF927D1